MSDRWTNHLSEFLDGDLPPRERRLLERHLGECNECRDTLSELRAVKERAEALVDPPAPHDLWAGIAARIGPAGSASAPAPRILRLPARHAGLPWRALAAAAAVVVVLAATLWVVRGRVEMPLARLAPQAADTSVHLAAFDATRIDGEIAQLQQALDRGRGKLDPATVKVLETNLETIRKATDDARAALARDPANRELQDYFASTVQSKLDLMRRATAMAGV